ncbi:hypothetical protein HFP89_10095 [Wenzhouxiangella sp. XN79A]|uniref:hypothetical protein n=1 Tax=Wenzhouxiangella sp. XN79A TaxID=2724193 RepID=UPI00144A9CA4|nr:hypothetical protein [Wenzhouxiangella sp. XN79A]NKI35517.1 hypothetical protein [Wenzhouxiangella sp. XN79A]
MRVVLFALCVVSFIGWTNGDSLAQESTWTDSSELVQGLFDSAYDRSHAERVVVVDRSFFSETESVDVAVILGLESTRFCDSLNVQLLSDLIHQGRVSGRLEGCRVKWISMVASESELELGSSAVMDDAKVIADPLLGMLFIDYGSAGKSPYFLLDERSRRVNAMDLIADASIGAGVNFAEADLQQVVFAHHRQEWLEDERPPLKGIRNLIQGSLNALFGKRPSSSSDVKVGQSGENCDKESGSEKLFGFCNSCRNGGPGTESCACTNSAGASCVASCFSHMYACCECGPIMQPRCTCCTSGGGGGGVGSPSLPPLPGGPGDDDDDDEDGY